MKTLQLKTGNYRIAEFDQRLTSDLLKWAKERLPNPLDEIKSELKNFSPHIQELMVREAIQAKRMPKSIDHPEIQALLKTPEGLEKVMGLMFQRFNPELSIEQIWEIHKEATETYGENYIEQLPDKPRDKEGLTFNEAMEQSGR